MDHKFCFRDSFVCDALLHELFLNFILVDVLWLEDLFDVLEKEGRLLGFVHQGVQISFLYRLYLFRLKAVLTLR